MQATDVTKMEWIWIKDTDDGKKKKSSQSRPSDGNDDDVAGARKRETKDHRSLIYLVLVEKRATTPAETRVEAT